MSEFKVIETQEQLDAVLGERLKRERETVSKRYEGWKSPEEIQSEGWMSPDDAKKLTDDFNGRIKALEDAAATTQQELAAKDAAIAESAKYRTDLEKTRIALAAGLKIEYADRLMGETAEEWKADAEKLAKDFASAHIQAPLGSPEPTATTEPDAAKKFAAWMSEQMND